MKEVEKYVINQEKSKARLSVNLSLLLVAFTIFTFIATINPDMLAKEIFLTLQLVCAIPLLLASTLARSKLVYSGERKRFSVFAFVTFLVAYTFLINSIGILLFSLVSSFVAWIFFGINIITAVSYSAIEVSYNKSNLKERIIKDVAFIILIVILGILPVL